MNPIGLYSSAKAWVFLRIFFQESDLVIREDGMIYTTNKNMNSIIHGMMNLVESRRWTHGGSRDMDHFPDDQIFCKAKDLNAALDGTIVTEEEAWVMACFLNNQIDKIPDRCIELVKPLVGEPFDPLKGEIIKTLIDDLWKDNSYVFMEMNRLRTKFNRARMESDKIEIKKQYDNHPQAEKLRQLYSFWFSKEEFPTI